LQRIKGKTYAAIKAAHTREYQQYFNTFSIRFGKRENEKLPTDERIRQFATSNDPSFVALYAQYGRYLLIASSRPGTRPANLQGIWNDLLTPPWGSKYTTNINAEMNYWPAESLNLSPLHEPLFTMIEELSRTGAVTAKEYYNAPGWVLHHNTDLWRGTAPINASNHGIWVSGGAWLSHHLWEHYLYTQDKTFLKNRAYPLMKGAARFFHHYLVKDPQTGWLISGPSNSPEQGGLVMGPSMDHQIIRSLFKAVIQASDLLQSDRQFRDSLQQKLVQMAPDQIGKHGQLQEWLQDIDDPDNKHRHVSHLWAVYPGKEINWDVHSGLMKAARRSLLYRGDAATGWSLGWKINFWARFKDGDHAYKLIQMLLSPAEKGGAGSYVNLFDAHPPFQIDGNFGGAAGIGELLVQSHTAYIDLLPALPSALPGGEVKGICARGGFVIDMKWQNSQLQNLQVHSKAGAECVLRYNGKVQRFKTIKGKTYHLTSDLLAVK
jgi:alpha-L-fucosidase 2